MEKEVQPITCDLLFTFLWESGYFMLPFASEIGWRRSLNLQNEI